MASSNGLITVRSIFLLLFSDDLSLPTMLNSSEKSLIKRNSNDIEKLTFHTTNCNSNIWIVAMFSRNKIFTSKLIHES